MKTWMLKRFCLEEKWVGGKNWEHRFEGPMDENVKNHAGFVSLIKNLSFLVFQTLDKVTTTVDIEIPKASLENQPPTCEEFIGNVRSKCVICVLHWSDVGARQSIHYLSILLEPSPTIGF